MTATRQVHNRFRVAIVIPVCNEQDALPVLKSRLGDLQRNLQDRYTVFYLFVDDGSTDETARLLSGTVPEGAAHKVIPHGVNRGVGAAFRTGFDATANADVVCTLDADCSYRAEDLVQMVDLIADGKADVVVASPYHPQGLVEGVPPWRLGLSRYCSLLYRLLSPLKLYTYTSMFRAYRGSFVRRLQFRSSGFVSIVEILMCASYFGYRIHEVPLTLHSRVAGCSKMRIVRTVREHLRLLMDCKISRNSGYPSFCRPVDAPRAPGKRNEMGRLIKAQENR